MGRAMKAKQICLRELRIWYNGFNTTNYKGDDTNEYKSSHI